MTNDPPPTNERGGGDADIAMVAALFADPTRARVLLALADGRSLPASMLASEAGVSPQAASAQLNRLRRGGLIADEKSGRHRYYRLASDHVATILEALAAAAPTQPVRSLRQGTRAAALRRARTCYDHLAGKLGCDLTQTLIDVHALRSVDGVDATSRRPSDPLSAPLPEHRYQHSARTPPRCSTGSASTFTRRKPRREVAGRYCGSASTGANNATTLAAAWAPPSSRPSSSRSGSLAAAGTAPSP